MHALRTKPIEGLLPLAPRLMRRGPRPPDSATIARALCLAALAAGLIGAAVLPAARDIRGIEIASLLTPR